LLGAENQRRDSKRFEKKTLSESCKGTIMKLPVIVAVLIGSLAFALAPGLVRGEDQNWPQWRGPAGSGETTATDEVIEWGPERNVKWRVALPERGNSTPSVWGNRVLLTQPIESKQQRALLCFDRATGEELWRKSVQYDEPEPTHRTNPYCSASPVTDGERVVAWFGSAGLICWDLNGNELWRRDLGQQEHMWGYGSSPIFYEDLCILNFGPGKRELIIAVDKVTGQTRWQVDTLDDKAERSLSGPENDGGANDFESTKPREQRLRGSWSTPLVIDVDGHPEMIVTLPRRVSAFDPATGNLLWTCGGGAPLAYASPMESDGVIVALGGYRGASFAVRAGGEGDVTETHRLWHQPSGNGWLGTGIIDNGLVYAADMGGVLTCFEADTGEEVWKGRAGGGGTWSSITQTADGLMFLLTKSGTTMVFRPDREQLDQVAENALNENTNASVVIAGDDLLIRTDQALWCFGEK
jgi:outer membrane protein assembly factor BamB